MHPYLYQAPHYVRRLHKPPSLLDVGYLQMMPLLKEKKYTHYISVVAITKPVVAITKPLSCIGGLLAA